MYKKWQKLDTFVKKGYIFYTFCKCVQYLPPFVFLKYKFILQLQCKYTKVYTHK